MNRKQYLRGYFNIIEKRGELCVLSEKINQALVQAHALLFTWILRHSCTDFRGGVLSCLSGFLPGLQDKDRPPCSSDYRERGATEK